MKTKLVSWKAVQSATILRQLLDVIEYTDFESIYFYEASGCKVNGMVFSKG